MTNCVEHCRFRFLFFLVAVFFFTTNDSVEHCCYSVYMYMRCLALLYFLIFTVSYFAIGYCDVHLTCLILLFISVCMAIDCAACLRNVDAASALLEKYA